MGFMAEEVAKNAEKGRKLLVTVIVVFLTLSFLTIALNAALLNQAGSTNKATYELVQGAFRFALECLLFMFIYKGHRWARITAIVLFIIGGLFSIVTIFTSGIHMSIITLVYVFAVAVLLSTPVGDYQFQKKKSKTDGN